jgi:predicted enzyme related to lactoylglutathione lyase
MNLNPKYIHTNIIAKDWKKLADFYIEVFNCVPVPPERFLKGKWIEDATGIKNVEINGIHLQLPGYNQNPPTLEIFQYSSSLDNNAKSINCSGFAHIAFHVEDVNKQVQLILENGGTLLGEIVTRKIENVGIITFVYSRDPEGNIIEIQKWSK